MVALCALHMIGVGEPYASYIILTASLGRPVAIAVTLRSVLIESTPSSVQQDACLSMVMCCHPKGAESMR